MAEASTYQCPNCNGVLAFDAATGRLVCAHCGHAFQEGELEGAIPLSTSPVLVGGTEHATTVEDFLEQAPWRVAEEGYANAVAYSCPSCGAGIVADQSTVSTACPFCGNNMLVQGIATADSIPQWVMPFTVTKEQAEACMREHFKRKWYLSRKFSAQIQHLQGVYVPYHLYDLHVSGYANYIGCHEVTDGKGNRLHTSYLAMRRAGVADIAMLPVDGSSKMPDAHMDAIAPFDFAKLCEFSASYIAGYLAEVADEDAQACLPRASKRAKSSFEQQLAADAQSNPKVESLETTSHKTNVQVVDVKSCVLPVWLLHCTWAGHDMLFAVNGDTGRCVGDLPIDRTRRIMTLVVGFAISIAIAWPLFYELFTNDDMPGFMYILAFAIAFSPLFADMFFKDQMHTAVEAEGDGLDYSSEGLVLTEQWDGPKFHLKREKAVADLKARPRNLQPPGSEAPATG